MEELQTVAATTLLEAKPEKIEKAAAKLDGKLKHATKLIMKYDLEPLENELDLRKVIQSARATVYEGRILTQFGEKKKDEFASSVSRGIQSIIYDMLSKRVPSVPT